MNDTFIEDHISKLRASGAPFAIATVVRTVNATSAKPGDKAIVLEDGTITEGWIGGGCVRSAVKKASLIAMKEGAAQFISLKPEELLKAEGVASGDERDGIRFARNGCPSKGSMDIFIEPVVPQAELVICGRSPVALSLADLAGGFNFSRTLCAPELRAADAPVVETLQGSYEFTASSGGAQFVVVATQGQGDEPAMRAALSSGASYIAFVGSRQKFETIRQRLIDAGISQELLDNVKSPAGLDIGAITPDEIALSILSEVVAHRRSHQRIRAKS